MDIYQYHHHETTILTLSGRLDALGTDILNHSLDKVQHGRIILDMVGVDFINSTGLRQLAYRLQQHPELCLVNLHPNIERALDMVGLLANIPTYLTLQAALA